MWAPGKDIRHGLLGLVAVSSFLHGGCGPAPETLFKVAVVPATQRVTRSEPIEAYPREIRLDAARNEYEPFQLVVQASHGPVKEVNVEISELLHSDGKHALTSTNTQLFREYFLYVLQPSGGYHWIPRIEYPGPLLPFFDPYDPAHRPYGAPFDITRIGSVGKPYVRGREGPGFAFPAGHYTGRGDRRYVVQIDHSGPAGEATFRWSDRWIAGFDGKARVWRWNAQQVPVPHPHEDGRTTAVRLNHGVKVWFTSKPSARFEKGHTYHWNAYETANEVVWGDVYVPPDAPAGTYLGEAVVRAGNRNPVVLPVTLRVWPFALPAKKSIATAFHGWMDARFYADSPDADWLFEVLQHEHRLDTQSLHGQSTGWGRTFPEVNWSGFDDAAAGRLDGSVYPDGVPMKRFHPQMYTCGEDRHWTRVAKEDRVALSSFARLTAAHLKEKGWFDRVYLYCKDEPRRADYPAIARDIRLFLDGDSGWKGKFMLTARPTPDHPLLDLVDIWCAKYHWAIDPAVMEYLEDHGKKLWCYVANSPYAPNPGYHVDSLRGYEPRIIKWASWARGATGFLYWASSLDQRYPNHWTTPMNDFGACGDGNLFYYGARNGPVLNDGATPLRPIMGPIAGFRLKQIREGLEDWEYLLLCEKLKGRPFTAELVSKVYRGPGGAYGTRMTTAELDRHWTQDATTIYQVRRELAAAIVEGLNLGNTQNPSKK